MKDLHKWKDEMRRKVAAFIMQDRQWRRVERLAHAEYQLKLAKTPMDKWFWEQVREANA